VDTHALVAAFDVAMCIGSLNGNITGQELLFKLFMLRQPRALSMMEKYTTVWAIPTDDDSCTALAGEDFNPAATWCK
jgi:hypothetical protein